MNSNAKNKLTYFLLFPDSKQFIKIVLFGVFFCPTLTQTVLMHMAGSTEYKGQLQKYSNRPDTEAH